MKRYNDKKSYDRRFAVDFFSSFSRFIVDSCSIRRQFLWFFSLAMLFQVGAFAAPVKKEEQPCKRAAIEKCQGLVLVGSVDDVLTRGLHKIHGLVVIHLAIPGGSDALQQVLNPIYLNKKINKATIAKLKSAIAKYYKDHKHPLVMVTVPEQDVTEGVLQLVVTEGRVGKVSVEGNQWFGSKRLSDYLRLKPNEEIDEDHLMEDLSFINRNPYRKVDVIYAPGEKSGTTDVKLLAADHWPWRFYLGGENTGVQATGRQRWIAGINWANAWGLDHILAIQYSPSSDCKKFQAYTGQYQAPLPWRHVLNFYGGYSQVRVDLPFPDMKNHGSSIQVSGRYMVPLGAWRHWIHEVYGGLDWKRTNNTVEFGGLAPPVVAQNANLFQGMAGYAGNYDASWARISMDWELFFSPLQFLPNQTHTDYNNLTPGAKPVYIYSRTSWSFLFRLPADCSLSTVLRGQLSSANLLPTEQYGIGGYSSVRGYEERQLNYEQAALASLELRSPSIGLAKRYVKLNDAIQFLTFIDWGWGRHQQKIAGQVNADYLAGVGVGARYAIDHYLSGRLDWGYKLKKQSGFGGGTNLLHFSLIASY